MGKHDTLAVVQELIFQILRQNRKVDTVYLGHENMDELRLTWEHLGGAVDWRCETIYGRQYLEVKAEHHIHVSMEPS